MKSILIILILITGVLSVTLRCDFRSMTWVALGTQYGCGAVFTSYENETILTNVTGDHTDGRSDDDVKLLLVSDRYLIRLPIDIEKFFANLIGIRWYGGAIQTINEEDLRPFPNMRGLDFGRNQIVTLDGNLLRNALNLQWIFVDANLIEHVGEDLLYGLNYLGRVDFRFNPCIDINANSQEAIEELNRILPINCPLETPPTTPPSPEECPEACLDLIETFETEVRSETSQLRNEVIELREMNLLQGKTIIELSEINASYEQRLSELEHLMKELIANKAN